MGCPVSRQATPDTRSRRDDHGASTDPLLLQLLRAAHKVESQMSADLAELGVSPEQWRLLSVLAVEDGRTMSELSRLAVLPPASTTRGVDRLVTLGLAYRRADPVDRRRVVVHLSARGRRRIAAVRQAEAAVESDVADALGARGYVGLIEALGRIGT